MSNKVITTSVESPEAVEKIDWATLLPKEDLQSLAGYFDALIEMDFEAKRRASQNTEVETATESEPK
jgi:hypothetical protein